MLQYTNQVLAGIVLSAQVLRNRADVSLGTDEEGRTRVRDGRCAAAAERASANATNRRSVRIKRIHSQTCPSISNSYHSSWLSGTQSHEEAQLTVS